MENCIGKTVVINGTSKTVYYCIDCGESLKVDDYIFGDDMCNVCRSKHYDRSDKKYIDLGGTNKVDEILLKKRERN